MSERKIHYFDGGTVQFSAEAGAAFMRDTYLARVEFDDGYLLIVQLPDGRARRPESESVLDAVGTAKAARQRAGRPPSSGSLVLA